ncbi:hypothetical protein GF351_05010 [Candidatus Woesearchaeota archaeon]|nr:hypothetical protein [Candidatus Woesearchaeota archaeon]
MSFFNGVKKGTALFGHCITAIINSILLTLVYALGVGITAVLAKLCRKNFLDTDLKGRSYWKKLDLKKRPIEEYYRQF